MNPSGESVTAGAGGVTGGVAGVAGDTGGAPHGLIRVTGSGVGVGEVGSLMVPSLHLARAVADFRKLASARRPLVSRGPFQQLLSVLARGGLSCARRIWAIP